MISIFYIFLVFSCFFILKIRSQVEVYRIFDTDGTFVNKSIPLMNNNLRDQGYDVYHIRNGHYYYFNKTRIFMDCNANVIKPISGFLHDIYRPKVLQEIPEFSGPEEGLLTGNIFPIQSLCHYWHFHYETIGQLLILQKSGVFERYKGQKNFIHFNAPCLFVGMYREISKFYGLDEVIMDYRAVKSLYKLSVSIKSGNIVMTTNTAKFLPITPTARFINEKVQTYRLSVASNRTEIERNNSLLSRRRIFIGRDDKNTRGINNMNELMSLLEKWNIYFYNPGLGNSYFNQIYLFSHAELVIGVSGTGFSTNMAFCQVNSTVLIEIIPQTPATSTGYKVANALNFAHYHRFIGGTYNSTDSTRQARFHLNVTMLDDYIRHVFRRS